MPALLWIPATIAAAIFQVGRNALQRGVMSSAGPWAATLVRFLFGLPFSTMFAALALLVVPAAHPRFTSIYWLSAIAGAASQVLATAALLESMHRAGFTIGTALQQSALPLAALLGLLIYNDQLSATAWTGVAVTTAGVAILTWPSAYLSRPRPVSGAAFGLLSGLLFGFSLNAFRHSALALDSRHPVAAAMVTLAIVHALQAVTLTLIMLRCDRPSLRIVLRCWRPSLAAGLCGACASSGWLISLALSTAASVRALGIIEAPIAAIAGHRLYRERLGLRQIGAGSAVAIGIILTSLF